MNRLTNPSTPSRPRRSKDQQERDQGTPRGASGRGTGVNLPGVSQETPARHGKTPPPGDGRYRGADDERREDIQRQERRQAMEDMDIPEGGVPGRAGLTVKVKAGRK
jgi:hypothetical protein